MIDFIKDLFGLAKNSETLVNEVKNERSKTRGMRNRILLEVEFNIDLILEHYFQKEVPANIIIQKLKVEDLTKALDEGMDFSKIKKGKITVEVTGDNPFLKKYIGYDCEQLLRKIKHHIEQLKLLPELYPNLDDDKKVNVRLRLENLGKRYLLFAKFLKSAYY